MNYEQAQINLVADENITSTIDKIINTLDGLQLKATIASVAFKGLDSQTTNSNKALLSFQSSSDKVAKNLVSINKEGKETLGTFGKIGSTLEKLNNLSDKIIISGLLAKSVYQLKTAATSLKNELNFVNESMERIALSGANIGNIQAFDQLQASLTGDVDSAKNFGQLALQKYSEYSSYLTTVNTIAKSQFTKNIKELEPDATDEKVEKLSRERLQQFGKDIRNLVSTDLKNTVSSNEALAASYEALSAGFKAGADSSKVMSAGLKLAASSGADAASVMNLLSTTLNAYKLTSDDAANVAAKLNAIVENGVTTVPQLTNGFGQLSSVAVQAKVSLDDLGGALAVLTQKGTSTNIAMTDLQALFATIISGSANDELLQYGVKLDSTAVASKGLVKTLGDVYKAIGESPQRLRELIPDFSAYRAAVALTGKELSNFQSVVESITDTTASKLEEVFNIRIDTDKVVQFTQVVNKFGETIINIGEQLSESGIFDKGLKIIDKYGDTVADLARNYGDLILASIEFNLQLKAFGNSLKIIATTTTGLIGSWITYRLVTMKFFKDVGVAAISLGKTLGANSEEVRKFGTAFYNALSALVPSGVKEALKDQIVKVKTLAKETKGLNDEIYASYTPRQKVQAVLGQILGLSSQQNIQDQRTLTLSERILGSTTQAKTAREEELKARRVVFKERLKLGKEELAATVAEYDILKKSAAKSASFVKTKWQEALFGLNEDATRTKDKYVGVFSSIKKGALDIVETFRNIGINKAVEKALPGEIALLEKKRKRDGLDPVNDLTIADKKKQLAKSFSNENTALLAINGLLAASTDKVAMSFKFLKDIVLTPLIKVIGLVGNAMKFLLLTPIGLLITGLTAAIALIVSYNKSWREANTFLKEVSNGQEQLTGVLERTNKGIGNLINKVPLLKATFADLSIATKDFISGLKLLPYLLTSWYNDGKWEKGFAYLKTKLADLNKSLDEARTDGRLLRTGNVFTKELKDRADALKDINKGVLDSYRSLWQGEERVRTEKLESLKRVKEEEEKRLMDIEKQLKTWKEQGKDNTIRYQRLNEALTTLKTTLSGVTYEYEEQLRLLEQQKKVNKEVFIALDNYLNKQGQLSGNNNPFSNALKTGIKNTKKDLQEAAQLLNDVVVNVLDKNKGKSIEDLTKEELSKLEGANEKLNNQISTLVTQLDSGLESGFISAKEAYSELQNLLKSDAAKFSDNLNTFQSLYKKELEYMNLAFKEESDLLEQRKALYSAVQQHRITTTVSSNTKILTLEKRQYEIAVEQAKNTMKKYEELGGFSEEVIEKQRKGLQIAQENLFNYLLKLNDSMAELNKQRIDKEIDYLQSRFGSELTFVRKINEEIRRLKREQLDEDLEAAKKNYNLLLDKTSKEINTANSKETSVKINFNVATKEVDSAIEETEKKLALLSKKGNKDTEEFNTYKTKLNNLKTIKETSLKEYEKQLTKARQLDEEENKRIMQDNENKRELEKKRVYDLERDIKTKTALYEQDYLNKKDRLIKSQQLAEKEPTTVNKEVVTNSVKELDNAYATYLDFINNKAPKLKEELIKEVNDNLYKMDNSLKLSADYYLKELEQYKKYSKEFLEIKKEETKEIEKDLKTASSSLEKTLYSVYEVGDLSSNNLETINKNLDSLSKGVNKYINNSKDSGRELNNLAVKQNETLNNAIKSGLNNNLADKYIKEAEENNNKVKKVYKDKIRDSEGYLVVLENSYAKEIALNKKHYKESLISIDDLNNVNKEYADLYRKKMDSINPEVTARRQSEVIKTLKSNIEKIKQESVKTEKELNRSFINLQESLVNNLLKTQGKGQEAAFNKAIVTAKEVARRKIEEERREVELESKKWNDKFLQSQSKKYLDDFSRFANQEAKNVEIRTKQLKELAKQESKVVTEELDNAAREVKLKLAKLVDFDLQNAKAKAEDNKVFYKKQLSLLESYNNSELTYRISHNKKIRELTQLMHDEDVKAAKETLAIIEKNYADYPEVVENARKEVEMAVNASNKNRVNNLVSVIQDEIDLIKDQTAQVGSLYALQVLNGEKSSRELVELTFNSQDKILKKELDSLNIRKENIKLYGGEVYKIEAEIAEKQKQIVQNSLDKNKALYEDYLNKIQDKANSITSLLESASTSFQSQGNVFAKELELIKNIDSYNSRNIKRAMELETNENRRIELAKKLIEIQENSLNARLKIEKELFSLQIKSKEIALEKREIELTTAKDKTIAEFKVIEAENKRILNNDKAAKEEKDLAYLKIKAAEQQVESITKAVELLPKERELLQQELLLSKKQQAFSEENDRTSLEIEKAKLTPSTIDEENILNRIRKQLKQDSKNPVTREELSPSFQSKEEINNFRKQLNLNPLPEYNKEPKESNINKLLKTNKIDLKNKELKLDKNINTKPNIDKEKPDLNRPVIAKDVGHIVKLQNLLLKETQSANSILLSIRDKYGTPKTINKIPVVEKKQTVKENSAKVKVYETFSNIKTSILDKKEQPKIYINVKTPAIKQKETPKVNTIKTELLTTNSKGLEEIRDTLNKTINKINVPVIEKTESIKINAPKLEAPKINRQDSFLQERVKKEQTINNKTVNIELNPVITIKVEGKLEEKEMVDVNKAINDNLLDLLTQTKMRLNNV